MSGVSELPPPVAATAAVGSRSVKRSTSRWANRLPTTAEPSVAPIWRKKLLDAVAVPTCAQREGVLHDEHQDLHVQAQPKTQQAR